MTKKIFFLVFMLLLFEGAIDAQTRKNNAVDFEELDKVDSDSDKINDLEDKCPNTPQGVKVDKYGCPVDTDEDGIPDYKDKEPMSVKNAVVNQFGVTITEQMLAQQRSQQDSLATERSEMFNENPSLSYLKEIETKSAENKTGFNMIPIALKGADVNNDGFISTEEITLAIDVFFEGTSEFTVKKLNDLIDFFFEQ